MEHKGYGKIILFGEHFVVYGLPAIAAAVGDYTIAVTEPGTKPGWELKDKRPAVEGYKVKKAGEIQRSLDLIFKFLNIDLEKTPVKITLSGNLECASGIGASAALATSVARALNEQFNLNLNEDQINEVSYEGEKGSAGNPSGIDNTCATFGGLLVFEKNLEGGKNKIEKIQAKESVEMVLVNSKITQETKVVVGEVKELREQKPEEFERIFNEYKEVFTQGLTALEKSDWKTLGELMNKNHSLLQQITVSSELMDDLQKTALDAGALGAKLTGTGRGGLLIALTPGKELQEKVATAVKSKGYSTQKTEIGI